MGASPLPPWPHHPRQPGRGPVLGRAAAKAAANQTYATAKGKGKGGDAEKKICFHFRDHGNCPKKDSCPYSHDKELRKRALAARRDAGHQQTLATTKGGGKAGGKGGGKNGKPKAKAKAKAKAKSKAGAKPPGTVCPFFAKNGSCRKGANCDMVHSLATTGGNQVALPSNWGTAPSSASMSNPFAAFSIQIGSAGVQAGVRRARQAPSRRDASSGTSRALQDSVGDYWTRLARVVLALRAYGVNVGQPELEKLTTKATLLAEEFAKIGGDWHPTRMVRALRARFSAAALRTGTEEPVDVEESQKEIQAIGELILALGGRAIALVKSGALLPTCGVGRKPVTAVASPPAPARPRSSPWARHRPRRRRHLDLPRDAEAGETLLCGPDWTRWRWSLRPSRGAPTVEPPKSEGG